MRLCRSLLALVIVGALLVGCTSGDDTSTEGTSDGSTDAPEETPTGPAPGVTDEAIKVGVTYVDLKAIGDVASLDHGDYEKAFQIMFDELNADGGIKGRMIEPVFAPINPTQTASAEEACTRMTQDDEVFVVMGFLQDDAVLCPLELHQTAVLGGVMTPERLERAEAPWYTYEPSSDLQEEAIRAMVDEGELDGTVGVVVNEAQGDAALALLEELDVDVADQALQEAQSGELDVARAIADMQVVAERFESNGVDQVLAIGDNGLAWAQGIEALDYRPQMRLTNSASVQAYVADQAGRDLSVLDGAVAGNAYGPAQNIWELPQMQDCIEIQEAGGVPVPEPDSLPEGSGSVYVAGTTACIVVTLFQALIEAAGDDLNYGSLEAAADGLEVELPNQPEPVTFGPPPSADGDMPAYLFDWDLDSKTFLLREG